MRNVPLNIKQVIEGHAPLRSVQYASVIATGPCELLALAILQQMQQVLGVSLKAKRDAYKVYSILCNQQT